MNKIAVLGSLNIDLVIQASEFPLPGQTIHGDGFGIYPGGKGANQCVAAARLGAPAYMIGRVGGDVFGGMCIAALKEAGADVSCVRTDGGAQTGVAVIEVNGRGENTIVLSAGANAQTDINFIRSCSEVLDECDILLLSLEIPMESVMFAALYARSRGKTVILDPAPAVLLSRELIALCDFITPNETEMQIISGENTRRESASALLSAGARTIVNKAGGDGAYIIDAFGEKHVPPFKVRVVDTTAAGDTFNAALAAALSSGLSVLEAVRFANAAGALAVTGKGAQGAMPSLAQVEELLNKGATK